MFCSRCGNQIPDNAAVCPGCGAPVASNQSVGQQINAAANSIFNETEQKLGGAINDMSQTFTGGGQGYTGGERLQTDRSLVIYILLSIVTCGIYGYYFIYKMAHDVNIACEGDGETTGGLVKYIVLSIITCGIYAWIWEYGIGNRLASNAPRYGMNFPENGTTIIMWCLFGSLVCGIGPFIAMHILIKNTNKICMAYNRVHGLS